MANGSKLYAFVLLPLAVILSLLVLPTIIVARLLVGALWIASEYLAHQIDWLAACALALCYYVEWRAKGRRPRWA